MTIEKTYKLTIKNSAFNLTEEEVLSLYESCRKALNISITGTKPFDNPMPVNPSLPYWPSWPVYPGTGTNPILYTNCVTSNGTNSGDNSVMDTSVFTTTWSDVDMSSQVKSFTTNIFNKPSPSTSINFLSDDMEIIKENDKWRSSVQQALDKLKVNTNITTSEGIKVG